ncbi:dapdiamide synthesis protein DdaC-like [Ptychodera flava]|uniref:dapdiamide synthesis protein DdaC-like n=1 Tax=Ptychodera flava TaxID=63121 RepID=UPI00396A0276
MLSNFRVLTRWTNCASLLSCSENFTVGVKVYSVGTRTLANMASSSPRLVAGDVPMYTASALAGRPYFPGADRKDFPAYVGRPRRNFPMIIRPEDEKSALDFGIEEWAKLCKERIDSLLAEAGAILFRDLPLHTAEDFGKFVKGLGYSSLKYRGGAGRRDLVTENVMTASDEPLELTIELHTEMANLSYFPRKLLFFCVRPPEDQNGGETAIAHFGEVLNELDKLLMEKLNRKGVRYYRNICDRSRSNYVYWQNVFMTEERVEVEKFCREQGYEFKWNDDDSLTYYYSLPPTITHPVTKETIWFNQITSHHASFFHAHPDYEDDKRSLTKYPFHCSFGDGEEFSDDEIAHMRQVQWTKAVGFHWQQGDVLVLDNLTTAHARLGVHNKDSQRRILASLLD